MRDMLWSLFDRLLPLAAFVGGAWFHRSVTRASAVCDRAAEIVREDRRDRAA